MATQESQKEVQISFRTTPETKRLARVEAAKQDMSLNEWIKHHKARSFGYSLKTNTDFLNI
jgi:predicted HicB family RNase H-like nuclease